VATTKKVSTKIATSVSELHDEFDDKKKNARHEPLKPGSKILGKQKPQSARTLITTPVLTNRPVNAYIERVVNHADGQEGLWLWYFTEQSEYVGRMKLVEINNSTLQEIEQGFEWDIPYSPKAAEKIAAESFGKTSFIFKDGDSKTGLTREEFLNYKPKKF